jgi:hypothetical protein
MEIKYFCWAKKTYELAQKSDDKIRAAMYSLKIHKELILYVFLFKIPGIQLLLTIFTTKTSSV